MTRLRLVFAGTPEFALPALAAAHASGHELVAVYTQPDRPAGRGLAAHASPVKRWAEDAGLPIRQPASLRTLPARRELAAFRPDLMIVIAYGLLLPPKVLALPRLGCWNVHASLLPRWRGAAPIQRALEAGDGETGVCLMQMDAGLDTGPVLLARPLAIAPHDTAGSLHDRLAAQGAELLAEALQAVARGERLRATPQPASGVTYAAKLDKAEAVLALHRPAAVLERQVRAFQPWPVAELTLVGERARVHAAEALPESSMAPPGTILRAGKAGIDVATGAGILRLSRLQRAGGRVLSAGEYLNARQELKSTGARA